MIKRLFYRTVLLLLICVCGELIYQTTIYSKHLESEGFLKLLFQRAMDKKPEALYFSASPNKAYSPLDDDRGSISSIMNEQTEMRLVGIDTGAIHAGIYHFMLQKIPENHSIKHVIVNMNIRSFGKNWIYSPLENQLQRNLAYWNDDIHLLNRLKIVLKDYPFIPENERISHIEHGRVFDLLPLSGAHKTIDLWTNSLHDTRHSSMGIQFVNSFAFSIQSDNPRLKQFDQISRYCNEHNLELTFVILPENIALMRELVGEDLVYLVQKNAQYLKTRYERRGVRVLDLLTDLDSTNFYEKFPTEHYDQNGRMYIAEQIVKSISHENQ